MDDSLGVDFRDPPGVLPVVLHEVGLLGLDKGKTLLEQLGSLFVLLQLLLHDLHDVFNVGMDLLGLRQVFLGVAGQHLQVQIDVVDEVLGLVEDFGVLLPLGSQVLNVAQQLHVVSDDHAAGTVFLVVYNANHESLDHFGREDFDLFENFESAEEVEGLHFELSLYDVGIDGAEENGVPEVPPYHQKHDDYSGQQVLAHEVPIPNGGHRDNHVPNAVPKCR